MDDFEVFRARSYSAGVTLLGGLSEAMRARGEAADDQTPQRSRSCRCRPRADHSLADVCQLMVSAMTRMSAQEVTDVTVHVTCETTSSTDQPATVSVTDISTDIRPITATTTATCTTTTSCTPAIATTVTAAATAASTGQQQQQQLSPRHLSFSQQNRESGRDLSPRANRPSDLDLGSMRPRTRSMPSRTMSHQGGKVSRRDSSHQQNNRQKQQQPTGWEEQQQQQHPLHYHRIRSFSTSSKRGIVNRGDSIKKCTAAAAKLQHSSSLMATQQTNNVAQTSPQVEAFRSRACSVTSASSSATSSSAAGDDTCASEPGARRVLVLGSAGVGKTLLVQQFMTSENIYTTDTADGAIDVKWVDVMLDDEQCLLMIEDISDTEDPLKHGQADSYIVMYSVADRDSFDDAIDVLYALRKADVISKCAVILVANKGDMVRNRLVSDEEGRVMATRYDCKFVEVSALLSVNVDHLLAGLVRQIQLNAQRTTANLCSTTRSSLLRRAASSSSSRTRNKGRGHSRQTPSSCVQTARGIVSKLLRYARPDSCNSCDNLLTL